MTRRLLSIHMGGGSESARTTVGRCRTINVNDLNDEGVLDSRYHGKIQWSRDGEEVRSIGIRRVPLPDDREALRLHYTVTPRVGEKREIEHQVALTYTECNFGGDRSWFECPGTECGERVGKIHKPPRGDRFLCRECHDLGYESSQKSGESFYENVLKPLRASNAALESIEENRPDQERLRDYYETRKTLDEGIVEEFGQRSTVPSTYEEWLDELYNDIFGNYGFYGRCEATAKTTGERCRQAALGEHGKCWYHGGAPGSGIGEDQRDHEAERLAESIAQIEDERERDRYWTEAIFGGPEEHDESINDQFRTFESSSLAEVLAKSDVWETGEAG